MTHLGEGNRIEGMRRLATGVDLIEIERVHSVVRRFGVRFLQRVYTSQELEEAAGNIASLAARFAAKEAVAKALGCGIGRVTWQEIEISRAPNRQPVLHLHGAAKELAETLGLHTWSLSLSHSQTYAIALVVALGGD